MELVGSIATGRIGAVATPARPAPRRVLHSASARQDPRPISRDVVRQIENGHAVWRIHCSDMINRDRCVTVFVDDGEVVVVGPPGETARLSAGQVGQLRAALNEAAKLAER